jgi:hypothetical protein
MHPRLMRASPGQVRRHAKRDTLIKPTQAMPLTQEDLEEIRFKTPDLDPGMGLMEIDLARMLKWTRGQPP